MYLSIAIQLSIIYIIQAAAQTDTEACSTCCTAGILGIPGSPGPVGTKGEKGNYGIDGILGMVGPKGEIGLPATKGEIGQRGEMGQRGEKGEQATIIQHKSAFSVVFYTNPGRQAVAPMKYDTVITNVGSDYNKNTGKFVCQHPGTYVFEVTSLKSKTSTGGTVTRIMKNGQHTVSAWTFADKINSASIKVILELVAGDAVWTQPSGKTTSNYYYSNGYGHCTFSGFLLYAA